MGIMVGTAPPEPSPPPGALPLGPAAPGPRWGLGPQTHVYRLVIGALATVRPLSQILDPSLV